ncbi:MAG: methionyl aminopeptidase [Chitinivibrionales bacterium]|nr:methionyl aminopeptidase [Chitinivibrionales bacterium]MBD3394177.1 methionyl aminopeptidase [Chitinivibrionales bacterium]
MRKNIRRNELCWCGSGRKYKRCHMLEDTRKKRAAARSDTGPMVKSPAQIDGMRRAGAFNGRLMDHIRGLVRAGTTTEEINRAVHEYTVTHGHTPAPLNYHGFPKSVCTSINDVVCHGIPSPDVRLAVGDIVNVDITTIVEGFHGDSSETFMIGTVSDAARHLVEVTARALKLGIEAAGPGKHLRAIAEAIEPFVNAEGCSVVHQYTGHGIGTGFHEFFTVYHHVSPECDDIILQPGMTLTIEPMINLGGYRVVTDPGDGWTVRTKDGSLSAQFEHTVAITETGAEVLTLTPSQRAAGRLVVVPGLDV